ncbi:hypothetical protein [Sorangium sp. So ce854]|uniref:hypothetical protein n=1 Tax=Sorangium sp. So ce854 TaxID=3133322 RepID=UPI003F613981
MDGRVVRRGACPGYVTSSLEAELAAVFAGVFVACRTWGARVGGVVVRTDCQAAIHLLTTPYLRAPGAPALGSRLAALAPAALAALTAAAAPSPALAAGTPLVESKWLKLDGVPKEWPVALTALGTRVKGKPAKADLSAQAAIAYDDARVYVAADVTDDALRGGADHVKLVLGFPGGKVQAVALYPGQPGKTAGVARLPGGKAAAGGGDKKIVGELKFVRVGDKVGIELAPGRAVEWTEQAYPFNQDRGPVGGFEPLLLPWGGAQPVRYVWNGSTFAR